jgi:hypothetical protein
VGESSILAKGVYRLKMALLGDDGVQMSVFEHSKLLEERAIGAPGELKTILNTYKTSEFIGLK